MEAKTRNSAMTNCFPRTAFIPNGLLEWEDIRFAEPLSIIHRAIVMDVGTFHFRCAAFLGWQIAKQACRTTARQWSYATTLDSYVTSTVLFFVSEAACSVARALRGLRLRSYRLTCLSGQFLGGVRLSAGPKFPWERLTHGAGNGTSWGLEAGFGAVSRGGAFRV